MYLSIYVSLYHRMQLPNHQSYSVDISTPIELPRLIPIQYPLKRVSPCGHPGMKEIYDTLKDSQEYMSGLDEKLVVNRVPSRVKRHYAKDPWAQILAQIWCVSFFLDGGGGI